MFLQQYKCILTGGKYFVGSDWVDPEDPTVIAENELLRAASSIEAAALKLSQLKPRPKAEVCIIHSFIMCYTAR